MSDATIIRPVRAADFAAWSVLWDGYNAFYGRAGETALAPDITALTWSRFFDGDEPVHALVAECDGVVSGLAHYIFHRNTIMAGPICYMQDLFTLETARGKGIGRALIEAVSLRAREAGANRLYWNTHESNSTAMKLYDTLAVRPGFLVYRKAL
ncbi:MAG TPA: GNAT family N-acetyltransferase [Janthinobacterium sp.]|nr:GNAT family N-acetyltransferase [Janthinobacterium sp.]